jgi:hypothetical protein
MIAKRQISTMVKKGLKQGKGFIGEYKVEILRIFPEI